MRFWKYHGLGNDFIIINHMDASAPIDKETVKAMCDRRFGIGADGVMIAGKSDVADVRMIIINSDGSRAEMCGNGIRCFSKYLYDHKLVQCERLSIETDAGIMIVEIKAEEGRAVTVTVNMGKPDFDSSKLAAGFGAPEITNVPITLEDRTFYISSLMMGVPHTVIFTDHLEDEFVMYYGRLIENHPLFPKRTNVNFVKIQSRDNIMIRTWERGAGYTYACGTGACASVIVGAAQGLTGHKVRTQLRGGDLIIHWKEGGDVYMEGPAVEIYEGFYRNA